MSKISVTTNPLELLTVGAQVNFDASNSVDEKFTFFAIVLIMALTRCSAICAVCVHIGHDIDCVCVAELRVCTYVYVREAQRNRYREERGREREGERGRERERGI
jgi:hypothetical protein